MWARIAWKFRMCGRVARFPQGLGAFVLRQLPTLRSGVTAFTPVHLERGRGRGAGERTEEQNSRGRESEYNETARKTLREPLHRTVCQSHCCLPIDQQDCPPLQTGLVLFTEPCLVRPGKSHQLGRISSRQGPKPVLLKVISRLTLCHIYVFHTFICSRGTATNGFPIWLYL